MGHHSVVRAARGRGSFQLFHPIATVKAIGRTQYRSQVARDLACLFDVNVAVRSWTCMPMSLDVGGAPHVPDFAINNVEGAPTLLDAPDRVGSIDEAGVTAAAAALSMRYRLVDHDELYDGPRLRNAKDLIRYADHVATLGDRIRVLACLDEQGSLTMAETLQLIRESKPMAALAHMILTQLVEVDMDEALFAPETVVRRIRA